METCETVREGPRTSRASFGPWATLAVILSALFYYKWGGSLRLLARVRDTGTLGVSPAALLDGGVLATTAFYFGKIWPALVYGTLAGAGVRAALPSGWVKRSLGGRSARTTLVGALAGAPLMLCSCCVTPIFTGLHDRGARLEASLAVMLSSPGLNVAAIGLSFALLPPRVAASRVVAALVIVLGLSTAIGRTLDASDSTTRSPRRERDTEEPIAFRPFFVRFARSVVDLIATTLPAIVAGVLLSALLFPHVATLARGGTAVAVALAALVATLVPLPTFFEIPIALLLLTTGAPAGVAIAFLVAGPIVNLPSLFVIARESQPRVAVALAAGVWLVATGAGLASML